jgi:hypothetical protein
MEHFDYSHCRAGEFDHDTCVWYDRLTKVSGGPWNLAHVKRLSDWMERYFQELPSPTKGVIIRPECDHCSSCDKAMNGAMRSDDCWM